jgi:DNA-binding transcriptional LysR family regulator
MDLNLVKTFVKLAQTGSFTQAAKALGQPKSRVSRAISRLENQLAVQLVRRTTRQTSLTPEGEKFFLATSKIIDELEEEIDNVLDSGSEISGVIRITAPEDLAQAFLPGVLSEFTQKYPKVQIQTVITSEYVDLIKNNIDLAFRIGKLKDSNFIQKRLSDVKMILVASPDYIKKWGRPKIIKDLELHNFLPFHHWQKSPELAELNVKPKLVGDSFVLLVNMALQGSGITMLPDFYATKYLESGELLHILPKWEGSPNHLNLLYPTKKTSARVRLLIEMVSQRS